MKNKKVKKHIIPVSSPDTGDDICNHCRKIGTNNCAGVPSGDAKSAGCFEECDIK
jgi:hypothetical protein